MKGMNIIQLNTLHLNVVLLNGDEMPGEVVVGGGEVVPVPPTEPETPDVPDVPVEPKKFILSASVANGVVSATLNGVVVSLPYTANEGDTIVLSVQPNDGYAFEGWADGNTDNPRSITMTADKVLSAQCVEVVQPPVGNYIQFEDAEVERVLMSKGVSSDGVGITMEDAAAVTSIGTWFRDNGLIKSFLELSLFSNLKNIGGDTLGYSAFYSCDQLQSLGFPENAESIGAYCLYQCNNLSIDISQLPKSIKSLGMFAFQGVTTTGVLDLPNLEGTINWGNFNDVAAKQLEGIENLGAITSIAGFMKQEKLRYVNIPQTCSDIAQNAFSGCDALEQVICRATTPPTLGTTVFSGSTCPIYVPDASVEAYKTATNWVSFADRIHPLSEIEGSPYIQFADAEVERVLMANGVSSDGIGITKEDAANVTRIGTWFYNNTSIMSFNEFGNFTSITALNDDAFRGASNLQFLTIPPNVASIGWRALGYCSNLNTLVILKSASVIPALSNTLEGMKVSNAIYVADSLVESYKTAAYWSAFADKIKPLSEYNG